MQTRQSYQVFKYLIVFACCSLNAKKTRADGRLWYKQVADIRFSDLCLLQGCHITLWQVISLLKLMFLGEIKLNNKSDAVCFNILVYGLNLKFHFMFLVPLCLTMLKHMHL